MISSFPHRTLRFCLLLAGFLAGMVAHAQQRAPLPPNTRRCVWVRLLPGRDTTDFALTDTLTVVPSSVSIRGRSVPYDARTDRYRFVQPSRRQPAPDPNQPDIVLPGLDSVEVCYRVLPLRLAAPAYRRPRSLMDSLSFVRRVFSQEDFSVKEQILSTPGINKTGNLARGISFGNTQNVFVNSSLNLQLEGKLTDQIGLVAAISDQNVPFQPEGNTQQLQEFDRLYITLTHPRWNLTAGDVVLRNKPDYFLRFYKNVQGAALEVNLGALNGGQSGFSTPQLTPLPSYPGVNPGTYSTTTISNGGQGPPQTVAPGSVAPPASSGSAFSQGGSAAGTAATVAAEQAGPRRLVRSSTTVAGGVAKGKFASIDVAPLENVQGPYRLRGPNGEQFIIVLANSERVFLDGRLMTRGFDNDYVIDYNQAEVTFSPQHLITRNSRIKIDFEYSDFNYARSLYHLSHYQQAGRLSVHGNFYREADNPDNSPNLVLDTLDRRALRELPGNVAQATTPGGGPPVQYNRQLVLYNRETRLVNGQPTDVFTYPPDSTREVYNVRFTDVGQGRGNYVLSTQNGNANGRVYEFREPVGGVAQGRYSPVRLLPAPLQKQVVSGGASYQLDPNTTVFVDVAASELDLNRFSPQSDKGHAMRIGYVVQDRRLPGLGLLKDYRFRSALDYEYTSNRFAPIDRYRDIEFDRNWSTASTVQGNATRREAHSDNILNFALGAAKDENNAINYRLSRRFRSGEVNGLQHWLDAARQVGDVQLRGSLFLLNSEAGSGKSRWARGEAAARYVRGTVVPGYAYRFDKNRVSLPGDSVASANYFDEHNVFIQSQDSAKTRFRADYTYRRDQAPNLEQTSILPRSTAQTWQATLATRLGRNQDLAVLATYRDLAARDSARARTVLTKLDWNANLLQNQIRSELSYSVATGRELKRDYTFIAVPNGQGTHFYGGDTPPYNGRQDRDEFFEAQTPDAVYRTHIKVYLPTDDYILAFTNRFSYRLTTNAPRSWREGGGWRAAAARFSAISTVTLDRRTTDKSLSSRLNPFAFQTEDEQLLSLNKLLRNTLYFNRSNPIFGAEVTVQQTQQKVLLAQGTDTRNLAAQSLLLRRTLAQSFTARLTTSRSIRQNASTYLPERNFRLLVYDVAPEISYQPSGTLRFTGTYLRTDKNNVEPVNTEAEARGTFDELGLETRVSQVSKRTLTATARYVRVGFTGNPGSIVGLEILNALRPGSNFTWNLNLEQRLSNGLNLNLAYDGRKANGLNAVHTGRMQVSVLF